MKKEKLNDVIRLVLFIIIVILIAIIGYKVIQLKDRNEKNERLIKDYRAEIDHLKKQLDDNNNISEEYYISYSTLWMEPDNYTTLVLNGNGTFSMNINACEGVIPIEGKYTRNDSLISLTDFNSNFSGFAGEGITVITLDIQSDGTLKVNNDVACMFEGSIFSKK